MTIPFFARGIITAERSETVAPDRVSTLEDTQPCPQCGNDSYDGSACDLCDYVKPPEQFDTPDVAKSKVLQQARNDKDFAQEEDQGGLPFFVRKTNSEKDSN